MRIQIQTYCLLLVSALLIPVVGCTPASDGTFELLDTQLASLKLDDLGRTMDFVRSDKRFEQSEFIDKVALGMNRWARAEEEVFNDDGWQVDPLVTDIAERFSAEPASQGLGDVSFSNTDPFFLQQCGWLDRVAERISKPGNLGAFEFYRLSVSDLELAKDSKDQLADIVAHLHSDLSPDEVADLTKGLRGFDWIIRNVQLEEAVENDEELDGGPGYKRMPWQVLIYSRGDYIERAKLFILLAQQLGLDAVMLATGEDKTPWCTALAIGEHLFLFDTKLGMPIPTDTPGQIATLKAVKADKEILDRLDLSVEESLDDDSQYWVKNSDLDDLTALIYTSPELISRRMVAAQKNMKGDYDIKVSSLPSEIAKKLPEVEGMKVEAWDIDFKTHEFRRKLRDAIAKSSFDNVAADKISWHFGEEGYVDSFSNYRTARSRYFAGRFEAKKSRRSAIESFYLLMYSDEKVDSLSTDRFLQQQIGIRKKSKSGSAAEFDRRVKSVQQQMRLVRRDAGYFLAHCHFDNGNIGTAANWLGRTLEKSDAKRWRTGINYMLGRSLESSREYDRALEAYSEKDSTQLHGNLIRSRQLESLLKQFEVSAETSK